MIILVVGAVIIFAYCINQYYYFTPSTAKLLVRYPLLALDEDNLGPKESWANHTSRLLRKGLQTVKGPFQILTNTGYKIVVPNVFAKELGRGYHLDNKEAIAMDYCSEYPGFVLTKEVHGMMVTFVQRKLTPNMDTFINDIADEASTAILDTFGNYPQWRKTGVKNESFSIELKASSRVLLGPELCRDPRWLHITANYAADYLVASMELRLIPAIMRPALHWILPRCIRLRKHVRQARHIFTPELNRRKRLAELSQLEDKPSKQDAFSWMYAVARGREVDFVALQLNLSLAAIHTTGDSLAAVLADLSRHPETIPPLREEILKVLGNSKRWTKATLKELKLMDSFLKESSRVSSAIVYSMARYLRKDTRLSNGDILPQGSRFLLTKDLDEASMYSGESNDFDAFRYDRRQGQLDEPAEKDTFAGMDSRNLNFGYGEHVCPGRWFADINLKIALVFLVMRYDWRLPVDSGKLRINQWEGISMLNPEFKVEYRRCNDPSLSDWMSI